MSVSQRNRQARRSAICPKPLGAFACGSRVRSTIAFAEIIHLQPDKHRSAFAFVSVLELGGSVRRSSVRCPDDVNFLLLPFLQATQSGALSFVVSKTMPLFPLSPVNPTARHPKRGAHLKSMEAPLCMRAACTSLQAPDCDGLCRADYDLRFQCALFFTCGLSSLTSCSVSILAPELAKHFQVFFHGAGSPEADNLARLTDLRTRPSDVASVAAISTLRRAKGSVYAFGTTSTNLGTASSRPCPCNAFADHVLVPRFQTEAQPKEGSQSKWQPEQLRRPTLGRR